MILRSLSAFFISLVLIWQDGGLSTPQDQKWLMPDLTEVEAKLLGINQGEVSFEKPNGELFSLPFRELTSTDQAEVMRQTGWGRVWEDDSGKYHYIADLVSVSGQQVTLENVDGVQVRVDITRLSKSDQQYVEARRTTADTVLPDEFTAKVVGVHDGDTITVLLNNRQYKIRLEGIDAPELGQDYGTKSKQHLSTLVFGKSITGNRKGGDKYGRNLCNVMVEGTNANRSLVSEGLAWHYKTYSRDKELAAAELDARKAKKNIWSEQGPIAPWEWRKWSSAQRKNFIDSPRAAKPLLANDSEPPVIKPNVEKPKPPAATGSYWLNTESNVRHNRGCRWYGNTKRGRPCSSNEGKPCSKCGG
ncbi:MAG: thermonuclease family protein [Planctomycetaceae bacterium]|nr:thermonuclease family protein [Planctomycetaceae bacterium]